ncbi:Kelch-like protein 10 [Zootermopsis nevadensis]|uniref:Kelch-like protein 10 n=1 Tax=Zootermopsis nevadensis TaxID=136037 RepID=A0A067QRP9_ZOONE|nr:Kelch-like protein 10 [Zootermopsis nevadensis]
MTVNSNYLIAEVIDDMMLLIGGRCKGETNFSAKCYNDNENQWYLAAGMNVHRIEFSTCVIKNLPNSSDYAYKQREKLIKEIREKMLEWESK